MSQPMDRQRLQRLTLTGALAVVTLLVALLLTWNEARQAWQPDVSGPVLPGWSDAVERAARIEIDSPAERFALERGEGGWVMPSRDGYPVLPERLAELDAWLAGLDYVGARTADPDKHARLGLADSGEEGAATRVTVRDGAGGVLADILLGRPGASGLYVRFPGRNRTYAVRAGETGGAMPPIATAGNWLDLDFLELGANAIAQARIRPERGPAYRLERPSPSVRNFALREPAGWTLITAAAGNGPASVLARVRFRDVRAAGRLGGERVARHGRRHIRRGAREPGCPRTGRDPLGGDRGRGLDRRCRGRGGGDQCGGPGMGLSPVRPDPRPSDPAAGRIR